MRARKSLLWYIYPPLIVAIFGTVFALCFVLVSVFKDVYRQQLVGDLEMLSETLGLQAYNTLAINPSLAQEFLRQHTITNNDLLISIFDAEGNLLASQTEQDTSNTNNSEVSTALSGQTGVIDRFLARVGDDVLFVATPLIKDNKVKLITRVGLPLQQFNQSVEKFWLRAIQVGLLIAILATCLVWLLTRKLMQSIAEIKGATEQLAAGNLSFRVSLPEQAELAQLGHSINRMAHELEDRLKLVINQRNQLDAVLSAMSESVIAINLEQRIVFLNSAAEKLLAINSEAAKGKSLTELIRSSALQELAEQLLEERITLAREISLGPNDSITVETRATILVDNTGKSIGGLLVFNDVSELRRLEKVRTDFVANVSHELRTPITSIKGFVETLLTNDVKEADRQRFLDIVSKHCNRLVSIIDDLLDLSVLEQQEENTLDSQNTKASDIVDAAINSCSQAARERNISITRSCREGLNLKLPASLLEQALINYIDNAIKYSEENSTIRVEVAELDNELVFSVHDNGCGISPEHHERLFERFYRVDKARSRSAGGTGLGLSIVKHIAQTMGGYPSVDSSPGQGSTFRLHIPLSQHSAQQQI